MHEGQITAGWRKKTKMQYTQNKSNSTVHLKYWNITEDGLF